MRSSIAQLRDSFKCSANVIQSWGTVDHVKPPSQDGMIETRHDAIAKLATAAFVSACDRVILWRATRKLTAASIVVAPSLKPLVWRGSGK
jgi:hypothetical protein